MTANLLERLEYLGAHLDDERRSVVDGVLPVVAQSARPARRWSVAAAAAIIVILVAGARIVRLNPEPAAEVPTPSIRNGADIIVWLQHSASADQVAFAREQLDQMDLVLDTTRTQYIDEAAALDLARTLLSPEEVTLLEPRVPSFFRLYALPEVTEEQILQLAAQLRFLPETIDVNPPWPGTSIPLSGSPPSVSSVTTIAPPTTHSG